MSQKDVRKKISLMFCKYDIQNVYSISAQLSHRVIFNQNPDLNNRKEVRHHLQALYRLHVLAPYRTDVQALYRLHVLGPHKPHVQDPPLSLSAFTVWCLPNFYEFNIPLDIYTQSAMYLVFFCDTSLEYLPLWISQFEGNLISCMSQGFVDLLGGNRGLAKQESGYPYIH